MKILVTESQASLLEKIEGYKPVKGVAVDSDNNKNNGEYYKDVDKKIKKFNDGLEADQMVNVVESEIQDAADIDSRGMERLDYDAEPSDQFKKRVSAQVMGKDSELQDDINDDESGVSTKGNEKFLKKAKDTNKFDNDHKGFGKDNKAIAQLGDDIEILDEPASKKKHAFENKTKRLNFSKTEFLNEEHVKSLIPENYRKEDNKYVVVDKNKTSYLIECKDGEVSIVPTKEEERIGKLFENMKKNMNYNSRTFMESKPSKKIL